MIKFFSKNLKSTGFAEAIISERVGALVSKFPDLKPEQIQITLSMENSPRQTGPDLYKVGVRIQKGRYKGIQLEKSSQTLYAALADLVDHLLEKINRFGDKKRVVNIKQLRRLRFKQRQSLKTD